MNSIATVMKSSSCLGVMWINVTQNTGKWVDNRRRCVLTGCLQAEVVSDLLVVTWVGEVEDAVSRQVDLRSEKTAL